MESDAELHLVYCTVCVCVCMRVYVCVCVCIYVSSDQSICGLCLKRYSACNGYSREFVGMHSKEEGTMYYRVGYKNNSQVVTIY